MEEQLLFSNRGEFRCWLRANHDTSPGIWLILGKSGKLKTVKADEALEEALCFGWIDGLIKSIDDTRYLKKFSRRRKGSKWSVKNRKTAEKLINIKVDKIEIDFNLLSNDKNSNDYLYKLFNESSDILRLFFIFLIKFGKSL